MVSMFQTAALTWKEWGQLLVLAAFPLAAHELLIFLNKLNKTEDNKNNSADL